MPGSKLLFRNIGRLLLAAGLFPLSILSRLVPRQKCLWLFGNQTGFRDNSRYLFEHVSKTKTDVRAVWLAHTEATLKEVHAAGYEAVLTRSLAGRWLALRAGVGVICNGFGDLTRGLIGGMYIVQLWHGPPMKKILLDFPADWQLASPGTPWGRLLNAVLYYTYRVAWRGNHLVIATSDVVAERMSSAFGVPRERVAVLGTPRADVLLGRDEGSLNGDRRLREELFPKVGSESQIVLYAPTWREDGNEQCLWDSFDIEAIDRRFAEMDAVLVIKLHPYGQQGICAQIRQSGLKHVIALSAGVGINKLMRICDVVITDYSSLIADFSLLGRPIVYYTPDYLQYKDNRDFYEPLESLTLGKQCDRWSEVVDQVAECLAGEGDAMKVSQNLRERFNQFADTSNSERIVAEIRRRVGL